MDKVIINGIEYEVLGNIKTKKREYVFVLNGNDVEFYKKVGNDYITPNKDLTLEGNAGKSLTELNENVLLTYLKGIIKEDCIDKISE
ncbi:MAG: hypothetical protein IJ565_06610 [Bacilli bacterium]|nr:hypothetical protein [Bacilli bacterium]